MKKIALALSLAALCAVANQAAAQQSPWQVRARAVNISPENKSDAFATVAADSITVSDKTIPEIDISYYFTPNFSAELVLTYPQEHDVMLNGAKIGTFKHLPPTLTAKYHFTPDAKFSPYLGAGINYTRISNVELVNNLDLSRNSFGLAVQAGIDFNLDKHWSLNLDVKKVQIRSDVTSAGNKVTQVQVDPWLFGVGVGYRF
jgi:outer membrane protein